SIRRANMSPGRTETSYSCLSSGAISAHPSRIRISATALGTSMMSPTWKFVRRKVTARRRCRNAIVRYRTINMNNGGVIYLLLSTSLTTDCYRVSAWVGRSDAICFMETAHEQPSPGDVLITTEIGVHFLSVVPHHHRLSFRE